MKITNVLLLLSALSVAPVWAEEAAVAPSTAKAFAPTMQAGPGTTSSLNIEIKGPTKSVSALVADLEKDAAFKDAACSTAKKPGKTAKINCAKADSALMTFLSKNAPAKVHWSISATQGTVEALVCPTGCVVMPCPVTPVCCRTTTHKPC